MNKEAKRQALVDSLKHVTPEMHENLKDLKEWGISESKRSDFVWHILLQSFSTWGGSRGSKGLLDNPDNYDRVTFKRLSRLGPKRRYETLRKVFREAGIRYAEKKAGLMARNYGLVADMGGPNKAKRRALAAAGREAKITFMKRFHGIGDKYARNIWMDVYHPEFHDAIAVDERIKKVTRALGYTFDSYEGHERFYQDIATEAGLQGWELDRLLYNYTDHFVNAVSATQRHEGADHGTRYEWSRLGSLQLGRYAEYLVKMEFTLHGFDVYTAEVDDKGIDFVIRKEQTRGGSEIEPVYFDVQVKSVREMNYIYFRKESFGPRGNLLAAIGLFEDGNLPRLYLIPSTAWQQPNALFVDRDYEGRKSVPEWGLNLSPRNLDLLEPYAFEHTVSNL